MTKSGYIVRDECYAVIDSNNSARILHTDIQMARLLAFRLTEKKIGQHPHRVARIVVMEEIEEPKESRNGRAIKT